MSDQRGIEVIARGVCVRRGRLLLCHSKGAPNTYLPGGHVEFDEAARESLAREIREEMGLKARVGRFLGVVEHTYRRKGKPQCEINLVFEVAIPGLSVAARPPSQEDYIEFLWAPMKDLAASALEPWPLRSLLPRWMKAPLGPAGWGSTYGGEGRRQES